MKTNIEQKKKMSGLQKIGGVAALTQAVVYLVAMVLFLGILIPAGYGTSTDPIQNVAFLADNQTAVYTVNVLIYVASSVLVAVLALALYNLLKANSPVLTQTATVFGLIWAGVLMATAMIASIGLTTVVDLYGQDPAQAASLWMAIEVVQDGLGGGTEIVGGIWVLLASLAALRTGVFPRILNYLGAVIGAAGIVSVVPALGGLVDLFGLGAIVWFAWLGIVLLRTSPSALEAQQTRQKPAADQAST
ncbi:DUF4386 family protein [Halococcus sediminicola]|uniref:DUF4386 family protein n=1 Tax=Halococcus sediminicola TaxID=1264579 RepID=UPI000A485E7D|nr:DUF4386 family protein [Halococcus sediminicola]